MKDLVSSEIISQFRAHTSPIAALCFDPSGTLLVTASVHGNNINIFRIMPSHACSGSRCSDWSTSYAHLYKIYRGITPAVSICIIVFVLYSVPFFFSSLLKVSGFLTFCCCSMYQIIQDICFSHDSQWLAIVSSKGTCHIFVLSPFGGDGAFQALRTHVQGTSLFLTSAPPWWSTSSFSTNEQHSPPPPPCSLPVVSRIRCSDSGLLNSVSNAAASMAGKMWVPSGAIAATFNNSSSTGPLGLHPSANSLKHILVYTPSGFVVQHEIQSTSVLELNESRSEYWSAPQVNPQNEELRVKVEPMQWWDVCRRLDNLEREECISGSISDGQNDPEIDARSKLFLQENMSTGSKKLDKSDLLESPDRSHWYLSNAEVQINSRRLPIWQMNKVFLLRF